MFNKIRRHRFVASATCLGLLVAGGIAGASTSHHGLMKKEVLRLQIVGYGSDDLDVGAAGRSPGDTFFVQHQLWNISQTTRVGRYDTACTLEKDYGSGENMMSLNRCTATVFLADGTIELANRAYRTESEKRLRYAVVGGTGAYINVVGQATVVFGEPDTLNLRLVPSFRRP
jgi:hypothetical protein